MDKSFIFDPQVRKFALWGLCVCPDYSHSSRLWSRCHDQLIPGRRKQRLDREQEWADGAEKALSPGKRHQRKPCPWCGLPARLPKQS